MGVVREALSSQYTDAGFLVVVILSRLCDIPIAICLIFSIAINKGPNIKGLNVGKNPGRREHVGPTIRDEEPLRAPR